MGRDIAFSATSLICQKIDDFEASYLLRYESDGHGMWLERAAMTSLREKCGLLLSLSLSLSRNLRQCHEGHMLGGTSLHSNGRGHGVNSGMSAVDGWTQMICDCDNVWSGCVCFRICSLCVSAAMYGVNERTAKSWRQIGWILICQQFIVWRWQNG